jgi:hypothetical protein
VHAHEFERTVTIERERAGQHLKQQDAERVDVACRLRRSPRRLLWRDVGGGPDDRPAAQRIVAAGRGDSEIGELRTVLCVEDNIRRLQVPVDDSVIVCVRQPRGDVARHLRRLFVRQRLPIY